MELAFPYVLLVLILIIVIYFFVNFKTTNKSYKILVANIEYIKDNIEYKKILKKYHILKIINLICLISCIIFSTLLMAHPIKIQEINNELYNRNIILCMDVSASVQTLNQQIVKDYKDIVKNFSNERFGISIFNTTSILLVPLTTDYNYILKNLELIDRSISADYKDEDYTYLIDYITSGTIYNYERLGSSIIGNGLASCIYSFSNSKANKDKKKIIIFSTDNENAAETKEIATINEASELAKENSIIIYGIAPFKINEEDKKELEKAIKKTGGTLYISDENSNVQNIIESIENEQKTLFEGSTEILKTGQPQILFTLLVICLVVFVITSRVMNNDI